MLQTSKRDQEFTIQQQTETIQDKDDEIKQLQSQVEILTSGKNFIKKSYDNAMTKIKKIESENFIIPKKKDEEEKSAAGDGAQAQGAAEAQPNQPQQNQENDLAAILQNELRQLHFKLRQKDQIIQEFKKEAQAYYSQKVGAEGAMTARTSKFAQLIQSDQSQEQSSRQ